MQTQTLKAPRLPSYSEEEAVKGIGGILESGRNELNTARLHRLPALQAGKATSSPRASVSSLVSGR